jgi:hypothetical protein
MNRQSVGKRLAALNEYVQPGLFVFGERVVQRLMPAKYSWPAHPYYKAIARNSGVQNCGCWSAAIRRINTQASTDFHTAAQ